MTGSESETVAEAIADEPTSLPGKDLATNVLPSVPNTASVCTTSVISVTSLTSSVSEGVATTRSEVTECSADLVSQPDSAMACTMSSVSVVSTSSSVPTDVASTTREEREQSIVLVSSLTLSSHASPSDCSVGDDSPPVLASPAVDEDDSNEDVFAPPVATPKPTLRHRRQPSMMPAEWRSFDEGYSSGVSPSAENPPAASLNTPDCCEKQSGFTVEEDEKEWYKQKAIANRKPPYIKFKSSVTVYEMYDSSETPCENTCQCYEVPADEFEERARRRAANVCIQRVSSDADEFRQMLGLFLTVFVAVSFGALILYLAPSAAA